jgi:hypothetical protein
MSLGINEFDKKLKKDLEEKKVQLKKDKYGIQHLIVNKSINKKRKNIKAN